MSYKYFAYIRCENSDGFYLVEVVADKLKDLIKGIEYKLKSYETADPECYKILKNGDNITSEVLCQVNKQQLI